MKFRHLLPAILLGALSLTSARAAIDVSINIAPPVLPIYEQPPCPVDGYLWTPGYWAYGDDDYYWVPGVWVAPPRVGFLWTPGYWGCNDFGLYSFHNGYWGPSIGFYGGVDYGCGYDGFGYYGGHWEGRRFRYNTAVTRVNTTTIRNVYVDRTVLDRYGPHHRASFNGPGGINVRPNGKQLAVARGPRIQPTSAQLAFRRNARQDRQSFASVNGGRPPIPAMRSPDARRANQGSRAPGVPPSPRGGFAGRGPQSFREEDRARRPAIGRRGNGDGLSAEERQLVSRRQIRPAPSREGQRLARPVGNDRIIRNGQREIGDGGIVNRHRGYGDGPQRFPRPVQTQQTNNDRRPGGPRGQGLPSGQPRPDRQARGDNNPHDERRERKKDDGSR